MQRRLLLLFGLSATLVAAYPLRSVADEPSVWDPNAKPIVPGVEPVASWFRPFEGADGMSLVELAAHVDVQRYPGSFPAGDSDDKRGFLMRKFGRNNAHHESFRRYQKIDADDPSSWSAMSDSILSKAARTLGTAKGLDEYLEHPIRGHIPTAAYLMESEADQMIWIVVFAWGGIHVKTNLFSLGHIAVYAVDETGSAVATARCG